MRLEITAILTASVVAGLPSASFENGQPPGGSPPKGGNAPGIVVQVDTNSTPQRVVIDVLESTRRTFLVTEKTEIRKANVETNQVTVIRLDKVFPGDLVELIVEVGGGSPWPPGTFVNMIEVRAREIRGSLATVRASEILLTNGRKFALVENARFFLGEQPVSPDKLQPGIGVVLRQNPTTGYVTGVEVTSVSR